MKTNNTEYTIRIAITACAIAILTLWACVSPLTAQDESIDAPLDMSALLQELSGSIVRVCIYLPKENPNQEGTSESDSYRYYPSSSSYSSSDSNFMPHLTESNGTGSYYPSESGNVETRRSQRKPIMVSGLVVSEDGLVMMPDPLLDIENYESIEIRCLDGTRVPAQLESFSTNYPVAFCKIKSMPDSLKALKFSDTPGLDCGSNYFSVALSQLENQWLLQWTTGSFHLGGLQTKVPAVLSRGEEGSLLLDNKGQAFGMALGRVVWWDDAGTASCDGKAILADKRITVDQFQKTLQDIESLTSDLIYEVKLQVRSGSEDKYGNSHWEEDDDLERTTDIRLYGVLINEQGRLFLPYATPSTTLQLLNKAIVTIGDDEVSATYVGSFLDFGGVVLDCPSLVGQKVFPRHSMDSWARHDGLYSIRTTYKFGAKSSKIHRNRIMHYIHEEATQVDPARVYPVPLLTLTEGELLLDADYKLIGFMSKERLEKKSLTEDVNSYGMYGGNESEGKYETRDRLFRFTEIESMLSNSDGRFDPEAVQKTTEEVKRLVWIGVEYQSLNYNLAKYLDVLEPTKDGRIGLMVNMIYPESPAQKAGLQKDDILIAFQNKSRKEDLVDENGNWQYYNSSRKNYLTNLLKDIGEGEDVTFSVLRADKQMEISIVSTAAPSDQENAEKYKSIDLGFTAKNLTYEILVRLKLESDHNGVVVSRVESGSRLAVAELAWGILENVNGTEVTDVKRLKAMLMQHKEQGTATLTFFVRQFDQTRFFEIQTGWGR